MKTMKRLAVLFLVLFISTFVYAASQQTSSTTAAAIVDNVEAILNDSDNRMWTEGQLLQWLNDGMIDIVARSHCLEAIEAIDLTTDTLEYTVTSDYITVTTVHYIDSDSAVKALMHGSPMSVGMIEDVNEPVYWYDWGGKLGIYPTFTRTTETINVYYVVRPTAIIGTANVTTPAVYDVALTYYILAQAYKRDRMHAKHLQTMTLYESEMTRLRTDLNEYPKEPVEN